MQRPKWDLGLSFGWRIRKRALELCEEDRAMTIGPAMIAARQDNNLKERYFFTPMKLEPVRPTSRSRQRDASPGWRDVHRGEERQIQNYDRGQPSRKGDGKKGGGKGKKGKGKGKGSKGMFADLPYASKIKDKTPDGKLICRSHNHPRLRCDFGRQNCRFEHVCAICFKQDHNAANCPKRNEP